MSSILPTTFVSLAAASAYFAPVPQPRVLAPKPQPEATLERTIEIERLTMVERAVLTMMGNDQDTGAGMESTTTRSIVVRDAWEPLGEAGEQAFVRSFESLDRDRESDGVPGTVRIEDEGQESPLAGHAVRFASEGDGEWSVEFVADDDGESEWLEGLEADMDLGALLTSAEVEPGDSWTKPAAAFSAVLHAGGELYVPIRVEPEDMPAGAIAIRIPGVSEIDRWADHDGELELSYIEERDVDGTMLAVIELELDLTAALDVAEDLMAQEAREGRPETPYETAAFERSLEGKGQVLWDIEAGRLHSFEFEAEIETSAEFEWGLSTGGMELDLGYGTDSSTQLSIRMLVEAE